MFHSKRKAKIESKRVREGMLLRKKKRFHFAIVDMTLRRNSQTKGILLLSKQKGVPFQNEDPFCISFQMKNNNFIFFLVDTERVYPNRWLFSNSCWPKYQMIWAENLWVFQSKFWKKIVQTSMRQKQWQLLPTLSSMLWSRAPHSPQTQSIKKYKQSQQQRIKIQLQTETNEKKISIFMSARKH